MQIVIDIPDEEYARIMSMDHFRRTYEQDMICDGKPLPKRHGRLIDADDLEHITVCSKTRNSGITRIEAPTIIEADKGGKQE